MGVHSFHIPNKLGAIRTMSETGPAASALNQITAIIDLLIDWWQELRYFRNRAHLFFFFKVYLTVCLNSAGSNNLSTSCQEADWCWDTSETTGCAAAEKYETEHWRFFLNVFRLCGPQSLFVKCWSQWVGSLAVRLHVWSFSVTHTRKSSQAASLIHHAQFYF